MYIIYWIEKGRAQWHRYAQKERADYFVEHLKKSPSCSAITVTTV